MKKAMSILLVCLVAFALAGAALADVLWEPMNNSFYETHRDDCEHNNRSYYANDESGYLEFFTQPGGDSLGFAKNGDIFYVGFTFTDENGSVWGVSEYSKGEDDSIIAPQYGDSTVLSGWVKMDSTTLKYDSKQFIADKGPFAVLDADFSSMKGKTIYLWTYPNSGELTCGDEGVVADENFSASELYTDPEGNEWGHVDYYYGMKDCWVCVSDPESRDLPVHAIAAPDFSPTPTEKPEETGGFDNWTLAVIIVCVVVAISLALILTLGKKKKSASEDK